MPHTGMMTITSQCGSPRSHAEALTGKLAVAPRPSLGTRSTGLRRAGGSIFRLGEPTSPLALDGVLVPVQEVGEEALPLACCCRPLETTVPWTHITGALPLSPSGWELQAGSLLPGASWATYLSLQLQKEERFPGMRQVWDSVLVRAQIPTVLLRAG